MDHSVSVEGVRVELQGHKTTAGTLHHTRGGSMTTWEEVMLVLTLDVHELFGNLEFAFVEAVVVGDVALSLGHRDHHVFLLLPEHRLG